MGGDDIGNDIVGRGRVDRFVEDEVDRQGTTVERETEEEADSRGETIDMEENELSEENGMA